MVLPNIVEIDLSTAPTKRHLVTPGTYGSAQKLVPTTCDRFLFSSEALSVLINVFKL